MRTRYSIADFFCGCGGLSLGLEATHRFQVLLGSDINADALRTFELNHGTQDTRPIALNDDIRSVTPESVADLLKAKGISEAGELDCLVGGPPCEGFSQNRSVGSGGHQTRGEATRVNRFIDDPRNELFKWFVELARHLQPKVVLIENVPDLVRHRNGDTLKEVLEALQSAGYRTTVRVLNAANYGVPQMRRRAIFLATRTADFERTGLTIGFPEPTHKPFPMQHSGLDEEDSWLPGDSGYWPTVWEAIGDLPQPAAKKDPDGISPVYQEAAQSDLRRFLRGNAEIYNHVARPLGKSGQEKVNALKRGQSSSELPDNIRPKAAFHYSYSRLIWSEPARTITKFCYHVGSGMFTHPVEDRAITMREAARLQSFPDSFRFHSSRIRDLSSMIGSAVPPLLARAIGGKIAGYLDALEFHQSKSGRNSEFKEQQTDAVMRRLEKQEWNSNELLHNSNKLI